MMAQRSIRCALILSLGLLAGCTTVQKWAAGGAAVGAGVGAYAGNADGILTAAEGAFVGAAGGGLLGALAGDAMQDDEGGEEMSTLLDEKDRQIAVLRRERDQALSDLAAANRTIAQRDSEIERLREQLAAAGEVRTEVRTEIQEIRTEISIAADVLFASGSARLTDQGRQALDNVAQRIGSSDRFVMVEGHTDTDPIVSSGFLSNWELGSARSLAVLHYLIEEGGIPPQRLSAASFGEYQPIGSQKDQNRRAMIVLYEAWPPGSE